MEIKYSPSVLATIISHMSQTEPVRALSAPREYDYYIIIRPGTKVVHVHMYVHVLDKVHVHVLLYSILFSADESCSKQLPMQGLLAYLAIL